MKKHMKIEKKLIAISILAITIGIATVIPMTFFMGVKANDIQSAYADPWFNVETRFAYFKIVSVAGGYLVTSHADVQPSFNYNAINDQPEARMEYFEFTFYTNETELLKHAYCVSMINTDDKNWMDFYYFIENTWLNNAFIDSGYVINGIKLNNLNEMPSMGALGVSFGIKGNSDQGKKFSTALDVQTIYLDVKRICYITFNGNTTATTWTDDQIIQHLELTKTDNAFRWGNETFTDMDTLSQSTPIDLADEFPYNYGKTQKSIK